MDFLNIVFTILILLMLVGFCLLAFRFMLWIGQVLFGLLVIAVAPVVFVARGLWFLLRPMRTIYDRIAGRPLGSAEPDPESAPRTEATAAETRVVDGDTVVIRGERIRIAHIDAPEAGQVHLGTGADAGRAAAAALRRFLDEAQDRIEVLPIETDAYGRTVAMLRIGPYDVGLTLVKMGMAVADRNAPDAYRAAEAWARARKVGLWREGGFVPPDIHRVFAG
jgi:endonuclease YncB( thermonuclease family)